MRREKPQQTTALQLVKELLSSKTPQKLNRLHWIFKKWFTFSNTEKVYGIYDTISTLSKKIMKNKFEIRIIDLELYIIKGECISFNIKEELFKPEKKLLIKMIDLGVINVRNTSDINFENIPIQFDTNSKVIYTLKRGLCESLKTYYKRTARLKNIHKIVEERVVNIVDSFSI